MRITYLFDRPLPANETDSEQALHTIAALARAGADVTLVLPSGRALPDVDAIRAHYCVRGEFRIEAVSQPFVKQAEARKLWHALFARARAQGSDVLYTRNFPTLFAAAYDTQPYAYETYRPWFDQLHFRALAPAFRKALSRPHALGALLHSEYAAARYRAVGVAPERLAVVHNGYDPELIDLAPERDEARALLGLPRDRPIVAYTGHVNATKGIEKIVRMAELTPEALFLLVGHDGKGGLIEVLARRVPNVQLVPWQPFSRVAYYLKAADILVLPPSDRGLALIGNTVLPMKLFQYLAAGRAIVAPTTPDLVELLADGKNARLVPPGDTEAAARAVSALIADPRERDKLARQALESSRALTWDARAHKILRFLSRRLSQPGRAA